MDVVREEELDEEKPTTVEKSPSQLIRKNVKKESCIARKAAEKNAFRSHRTAHDSAEREKLSR